MSDAIDKIVSWVKGAVDFMAKVLNFTSSDAGKQMIKIVMEIIRDVQKTGKAGEDKRTLAFTLLLTKLPEIIELAVLMMKAEDKAIADKDGDGVLDVDDKCPEDPDCQ
ncbi:MAG TPA: hypothetical protein VMW91_11030 [Desulfosporosinus sp.]|nr:hypothetical protein [Desulfosporosinus sp.]